MRDIVIGKLVDRTIDDDYAELSERLFGDGNCFNSSEVRKRMYGMKAIIEAIERDGGATIQDTDALSALDSKRIELLKERQKFFDQRNAFNKLIRERSRQEELNEILVDAVKSGNLPQLEYEPCHIQPSDNDLLVSLNDIHYGANVDNHWNTYNSDICREMMCHYLDRIIAIAETHGSENCIVWSNGDAISGNIHQSIAITNKENVIEQIKGVSELIAEFVAELSKHFSTVTFVSVAGNHSRITPNKDDLGYEGINNILFRNESSVREYLKPEISFAPASSTRTLSLVNLNDDNREFKLTGIPSGASIFVNNSNGIIQELSSGYNLYDGFNLNFFRLVHGDNNIKVTGDGVLTISGRFLYNVAG